MRNEWTAAAVLTCFACGGAPATTLDADGGGGQPDTGTTSPDAGTDSSVSPTVVLPLSIAFTFHMEGASLVADKAAFDRYVTDIRATSALFLANGAVATWEAAEIVQKSIDYKVNILKELETAGHAIGLHANGAGYVPTDKNYTTEKMITELQKQRAAIDSLDVKVRHVSNICSAVDWVKAVEATNFEAVTGVVEYCLKSLPAASQGTAASCDAPNNCHTPYPKDTTKSISSWFAESGSNWTTPASSGLLILPTSGAVPCSAEEAGGAVSPTQCKYGTDDVTATLAQIDIAVASRQPGKVHSHILVASFGQTPNAQMIESLLQQIKSKYVDTGKAKWIKIPDLIDLRKSAPAL